MTSNDYPLLQNDSQIGHEPQEQVEVCTEADVRPKENVKHAVTDQSETEIRKSSRERHFTPKMQELKEQELAQNERKFQSLYDKWKIKVRDARTRLKEACPEKDLYSMMDDVEMLDSDLKETYDNIRKQTAPSQEIRRKVDACSAVTLDLLRLMRVRLTEEESEFDAAAEKARLRMLLDNEYARSIYGSTASRVTARSPYSDRLSESPSISNKRAEAAAQLAAKRAEIEMEETIEAHRQQLKKLENQRDIEVMQAKLKIYTEEEIKEKSERCANSKVSPTLSSSYIECDDKPITKSESAIVQAVQESIALTRLPVPEPTVFYGDPLKFVEWSASFKALIERRCSNPADRLFYLQKYIAGEAKSTLEGSFYRKDEEAYKQAWDRLNARYGHSFVVQRAFREKLNKWPKIGGKEYVKLREFSDFLQTCSNALPHIKGLQVLDDCEENQKLLVKLPDWITSRWNRYVTEQLDKGKDYPSFKDFTAFISKEARIACNPVSSLHALKPPAEIPVRETKRTKANAFVTNVRASDTSTVATKPNIEETKPRDTDKQRKRDIPPQNLSTIKCICCGENHTIHKCPKLTDMSADEKKKYVHENKLCFACLRKGHNSKDCKNRAMCSICRKSHPTPLHEDRSPVDKPAQSIAIAEENMSALSCSVGGGENGSTSMIVPVWISATNAPEAETLVYALLDTQSTHTFVDQEVCEKLQAVSEPVKLKLATMVKRDTIVRSQRVQGLKVRGFFSSTCIDLPPAYTRDFIPLERTHIPTCQTASKWKHLANIAQEIPPLMDCAVGLLIGYDCSRALAPREVITGDDNEPYAVKTDLGWSIVGGAPQFVNARDVTGLCHRVAVKEIPPITPSAIIKVLESDFADTKPSDSDISQEDIQFLQILKDRIHQNEHGHLEMPLPFKARPQLPNNKSLALVRLKHLKRKLDKDPKFKDDYVKFMEGVLRDGDAEKAESQPTTGNVWYIPHQGVYHPRKPDKIRVVFDCSAKFEGTALNDHLTTGPDLTNGLTGVLCRFRKHPIAVMCDVEKMFHRFHVSSEDRDYLRFLWWENGNTDLEPTEYRMKVHLFGASSSPGCANYGMKHLANENEKEYPLAANFVKKHFYVDDGLVSVETVGEAIELVKEAQALCAKGKLHLHKFLSNSRDVLDSIDVTERAVEIKDVDLNYSDLPVQRVLGIRWNIENDSFFFQVTLDEKPLTRRGILSIVASLYDPLGFLAPFILEGKRVLQEMCQKGIGWDDTLPTELKLRWESWMKDLENLKMIQIPRCFKPTNFGEVLRVELHHFSDASSHGYGQCSYIRLVSEQQVHCTLLMGKARVAPTRIVTIPRLELTAAVTSAAVSCMLKRELELKVDKEYFWTDSQVVLGYINNEAKRFHVFVANRVQRIRQTTSPEQWYYIDTAENPADHASRGLKVADLTNSNWLTGPKFLWEREVVTEQSMPELLVGDPEVKAIQVLDTEATQHCDITEHLSRFSKWATAVNVVARIQRMAKRIKTSEPPDVEQRRQATLTLVKLAQQNAFQEELNTLEQKSGKLACNNRLYQLDPFLQDGVMRVGGRLRKASMHYELKHPTILPKDGAITQLIIAHYHDKTQHQGQGQTLNEIRANGFWIVGGGKAVAKYIRQCVWCRRARAPPEEQRMADLPSDRTDPSPPFTYVGMDCFGPFNTKQGRKVYKRYALLFTCLSSRAVHLEMLEDMTTDAFINALRCFIAIRGAVRQIRSDQGSNFMGAKNEMAKALQEIDKDKVTSYLTNKQCDFLMNAPSSSHAGGAWERQIRTVRSVLSKVLAQSAGRLDDASLRTFLYEAMYIVNSRPLTVNNISDPTSSEPLTPNHLITMKCAVPLPPPGKFVQEDVYATKRWRRVQYLSEQFWNRWRKEYLANLTLRQRWHAPRRNMKVGDTVIVKDENIPRNEWTLGRVVDVHKGDDGLVRKVSLQVGDKKLGKRGERLHKPSIIQRPIQKLVVLVESS